MSKYSVEYKMTDPEGYVQSRRVAEDFNSVQSQMRSIIEDGEFEYLIVRRIKEKQSTLTVKSKETKEAK